MTNKITITYEEHGVTTTYQKELPESPTIDNVFEAYLEANERFTFQNDVTVNIHNPIFEDTVVTWDKENGVDCYREEGCEFNWDQYVVARDFKDAIQQISAQSIKPTLYFDGSDEEAEEVSDKLKQMFGGENWYMGYKY